MQGLDSLLSVVSISSGNRDTMNCEDEAGLVRPGSLPGLQHSLTLVFRGKDSIINFYKPSLTTSQQLHKCGFTSAVLCHVPGGEGKRFIRLACMAVF